MPKKGKQPAKIPTAKPLATTSGWSCNLSSFKYSARIRRATGLVGDLRRWRGFLGGVTSDKLSLQYAAFDYLYSARLKAVVLLVLVFFEVVAG